MWKNRDCIIGNSRKTNKLVDYLDKIRHVDSFPWYNIIYII